MHVAMPVHADVKVCQDEETREPGVPPPKRIRNPRIEIPIVGRWSIIGNYRRPLIVVIVVYHCGVIICGSGCIGRILA
jgi:hypothetical protein